MHTLRKYLDRTSKFLHKTKLYIGKGNFPDRPHTDFIPEIIKDSKFNYLIVAGIKIKLWY